MKKNQHNRVFFCFYLNIDFDFLCSTWQPYIAGSDYEEDIIPVVINEQYIMELLIMHIQIIYLKSETWICIFDYIEELLKLLIRYD